MNYPVVNIQRWRWNNHTKTPAERRLNFQKEVSLCRAKKGKLFIKITKTKPNKHYETETSYLVIDWYHKVSVDRGTIRLIFQGTLFGVQFNLWKNTHLLNSNTNLNSMLELELKPSGFCLLSPIKLVIPWSPERGLTFITSCLSDD